MTLLNYFLQVNGSNTPKIYQYLKSVKRGLMGGFINGNFSFFLVDKTGAVYERFTAKISFSVLEESIEKLLY
jgi:glutathione peroxidase